VVDKRKYFWVVLIGIVVVLAIVYLLTLHH